MASRKSLKLLLVPGVLVAGGIGVVNASAAGRRLGNGPSLTAGHPVKGSLPRKQALLVVQFRNGRIARITGTALLPGARRGGKKLTGGQSANCTVNFTNSTTHSGGKTTARWFGGIGCNRKMFMFGTAYLQESATKVDGTGPRYQGVMSSAVSGRNATVIDEPHPSLYIRHLTNVYFPNPPLTGTITVVPAKGQVLNAASKCVTATLQGHGVGVHCDLYTNRFT
jgi:hypothetical protein